MNKKHYIKKLKRSGFLSEKAKGKGEKLIQKIEKEAEAKKNEFKNKCATINYLEIEDIFIKHIPVTI